MRAPFSNRSKAPAAAVLFIALCASPATALEVVLKGVRTPASVVTATIDVRDPLPDRFKKLIDDGDVAVVAIVDSAEEALEGADVLAIVTEWQEFRSPDFAAIKRMLKSPAIFDGRNLYDPAALKAQGIAYYPIGRRL